MWRCYCRILSFAIMAFICCGVVSAHEMGNIPSYSTYASPEGLAIAYKPQTYSIPNKEAALFKMAMAGDSDIQFKIGLMFGQGNVVKQNLSRCLYLLEKAANHNHAGAAFLLGTIYLKGGTLLEGVKGEAEYGGLALPEDFPYDLIRAFSFYLISGNGGDILSQDVCRSIKEQILNSRANTANAVRLLHILERYSRDGNALAQRTLAELYSEGKIVEQDYNKAFALYKESAEKGDVWGQYNIARKYIDGIGVKKDTTEGFKWMKKAAERNLTVAQFDLSNLYYHGDGTARDKQMAYVWLLIAKENGHEEAKQLLDGSGTGGLTKEEENTAREIANKILAQITAHNKPLKQMEVFS